MKEAGKIICPMAKATNSASRTKRQECSTKMGSTSSIWGIKTEYDY